MTRLSDEQLMARMKNGQTGALDELYRRYAQRLYIFCLHTTRGLESSDPEELVQDVFMRVIRAADTFNPQKASFRTWMFRIARNRCIDVIRQKRRIQLVTIGEQADPNGYEEVQVPEDTLVDQDANVEKSVEKNSLITAVRECIHQLENDNEKQAILLYYLGEKVLREIAEILGKSTSTAKNWVEAAQEKVKHCLELKGFYSAF
jgi:RNA polymerase sigma factor (sigma-70 family)